jgi:Amt family ammonium transporter
MQAGFTLVETGFTRSKNTGNIIKKFNGFCIGSVAFWAIGYP